MVFQPPFLGGELLNFGGELTSQRLLLPKAKQIFPGGPWLRHLRGIGGGELGRFEQINALIEHGLRFESLMFEILYIEALIWHVSRDGQVYFFQAPICFFFQINGGDTIPDLFRGYWRVFIFLFQLRLVIRTNYSWWKKFCTTWDVWNLMNNSRNYLSTGAGFFPPTVCYSMYVQFCNCDVCWIYNALPNHLRSLWDIRHPIGPVVFVELSAGWFQHRDISTPQPALVSKGRAKGAIFPFGWW